MKGNHLSLNSDNKPVCVIGNNKAHEDEGPLFEAVRKGGLFKISILIAQKYDVNEQRSCDGFTPLMSAVSHNNFAMVSKLLREGADVNIKSSTGASAISIALKSADFNSAIIECLLQKGAKTSLKEIQRYNQHYSLQHSYDLDIIDYHKYKGSISCTTADETSRSHGLLYLIPESDSSVDVQSDLHSYCSWLLNSCGNSIVRDIPNFHAIGDLSEIPKVYTDISEFFRLSGSDSSSKSSSSSDSDSSGDGDSDSSGDGDNESSSKGDTLSNLSSVPAPYSNLLAILDKYSCITLSTDLFCFNCAIDGKAQKELSEIMPIFGLDRSDDYIGYMLEKTTHDDGKEYLEAKALFLCGLEGHNISLSIESLHEISYDNITPT